MVGAPTSGPHFFLCVVCVRQGHLPSNGVDSGSETRGKDFSFVYFFILQIYTQ